MANNCYIPIFTIFVYLFSSTIPTLTNGFTMKLHSRLSIDKDLFHENLTLIGKHQKIAEISKDRALYLRYKSTKVMAPNGVQIPVTISPGYLYAAQVGVGSENYQAYLLVDTTASSTWLQCEGCTSCFPLQGGNYKYKESKTFVGVPCDTPYCGPNPCKDGVCQYSDVFLGDQRSSGILGVDAFTFKGGVRASGLVFGCGLQNENISWTKSTGANNKIVGMLGLALESSRSFVFELPGQLRFSYCLPPWDAPQGASTTINFGEDAKIGGDAQRKVQTTPIMPVPRPGAPAYDGYYVKLLDITVDVTKLNIDPTIFNIRPDGSGGVIIDSAVGPTLIVEDAYRFVRRGVYQYFVNFGWQPIAEQPPYELCYRNKPSNTQRLPSMTFHFQDADLNVEPKDVFQFVSNDVFCLAVIPVPAPGPTLIGTFHQANHAFLFDNPPATISFVPQKCV